MLYMLNYMFLEYLGSLRASWSSWCRELASVKVATRLEGIVMQGTSYTSICFHCCRSLAFLLPYLAPHHLHDDFDNPLVIGS